MPSRSQAVLQPVFGFMEYALDHSERAFTSIPGSAVVIRYVQSSYRNDPGRTLLELLLFVFALWTVFQSRRRAGQAAKRFVKLTDAEIDELIDDWQPEPLVNPLSSDEVAELAKVPIIQGAAGPRPKLVNFNGKTVLNLASLNFTGLAGNEYIKERAIEVLRKYGLGSCGPPGFYGTIDVHMQLEQDIATFLGTESAIIYSQGFQTVSAVIPAFCKRGDIIVADRGVNFSIQKGLQLSRSTIRWYDHNDLGSLESVLQAVEKEAKKKRTPLTRRFIVTEGIFETDGAMVDLPKLIELKQKFKYRLVLDESFSFGTVGRTGRGLTELYNVPAAQIDMLVGSMANGLCSAGGFCAGARVVTEHQRINGTSFVFSAAMPAIMAVSASEAINIHRDTPSVFETLRENVVVARNVLAGTDSLEIISHPASALVHIAIKSQSASSLAPPQAHTKGKSNPSFDVEAEERLLQEVVDEALQQGVLITRAKKLRGKEAFETRPTIRLAITAALTKKETEKAASAIKSAFAKVISRRR